MSSNNISPNSFTFLSVLSTVNQASKPEFVTIQPAALVVKGGVQTLTLTGTSNSSKLTFSLGSGGTLSLILPSSYTANGVTVNNGEAITGDPGASQEYAFSIAFSDIPANTTVSALTAQVIVTDNAGNTSTCTVTQAAGDATLSVSPASVDLAWDGNGSATFTVTSNTNWNIE